MATSPGMYESSFEVVWNDITRLPNANLRNNRIVCIPGDLGENAIDSIQQFFVHPCGFSSLLLDASNNLFLNQMWLYLRQDFQENQPSTLDSKEILSLFGEMLAENTCLIFDNTLDVEEALKVPSNLSENNIFREKNLRVILVCPSDQKIVEGITKINPKSSIIKQLKNQIEDCRPGSLEKIVNLVKENPTALFQTLNFLKKSQMTLKEFEKKFTDARSISLSTDSENEKILLIILKLILDAMEESDVKVPTELAAILCVFGGNIEKGLLIDYFLKKPEIQVEKLLNMLIEYGVLTKREIHKQSFINFCSATQSAWRRLLGMSDESAFMEAVLDLVKWVLNELDYEDTDLKRTTKASSLISSAISLATFASQHQIQDAAQIFLKAAYHQLNTIGDLKIAYELYKQASELCQKTSGISLPNVNDTLKKLGEASWDSLTNEQQKKRKELLSVALKISERFYPSDQRGIGNILEKLGAVCGKLDYYGMMKDYLVRLLEMKKNYDPPDYLQIAVTMENLGHAWCNLGEYLKQRGILTEALKIYETHYHEDNYKLGVILTNLGNAWGNLGHYHNQLKYLEEAEFKLKKYDENHIQVAVTQMSIGTAYGSLGNYQKEKDILESVIDDLEKNYKNNLGEISIALEKLGSAWGKLGNYEKQMELVSRSLSIKEKLYDKNHPELGITLNRLAIAYGSLRDHNNQKEALDRALKINEKCYGKDHPQTCITLTNLGNALGRLGDYQQQEKKLTHALEISKKYFGEDHPNTAIILADLANCFSYLRQYEKEKDLLIRAREIKEKCYGIDHPSTKITLYNLKICEHNLGLIQLDSAQKESLKQSVDADVIHFNTVQNIDYQGYLQARYNISFLEDSSTSKLTNTDGCVSELPQGGPKVPSWQRVIRRRDNDFEFIKKPRLPNATSLSSGIFIESATGKEWLGKSNTSNRDFSEALACKERIATDIYAYFRVRVLRTELSLQKMVNVREMTHLEGVESVHTMSELIEGFRTYEEACGESFSILKPNPDKKLFLKNGEKIPEKGLGKVLAVAVLINDIDVIGEKGRNIGFQIIDDPMNGKYARTIKIDAGEAFSDHSVTYHTKDSKPIRVAFEGTAEETELDFEQLPQGTKGEFIKTLKKIAQTSKATFRGFLSRDGAHHFVSSCKLSSVDELTEFLAYRRDEMIQSYKNYLQDPVLHVISFINLKKKKEMRNLEEQAREDEAKAVQEELHFYIYPDVTQTNVDSKNRNRVALTDRIYDFLAFEKKENSIDIMLLTGEAGSGKSLTLRSLEQELLKKRRDQQSDAPMPIYVDLKRFNKQNIRECLETTLKEKYNNEFHPKQSKMIILMDGYDEIGGECQENISEIQLLKEYASNLRVIITCRTQYLTSGYQEWFTSPGGQLIEYEIQPFSSTQIDDYLKRYAAAKAAATKEGNLTFKEYKEKIQAIPNLEDLIKNPLILRLVTESLHHLDAIIVKSTEETIPVSKCQPSASAKSSETKYKIVNKYAIYKCFMDHWFAKQERRLIKSSGVPEKWDAIRAFRNFSKKVALILHMKKEVEISVKDDKLWVPYFMNDDTNIIRERSGCPLKRLRDHQYSFIHKSFQEYFAAEAIQEIITSDCNDLSRLIKPLVPSMITQDLGVVSFLSDMLVLNEDFKSKCLKRIDKSRDIHQKSNNLENPIAIAAANAATLLNIGNYDFSGNKDFRGVCIPGANLSNGSFEGFDFSNADLSNVNFAGAVLKNATLRKANMQNTFFGEWPYIKMEQPTIYAAFSDDGKAVAVLMKNAIVVFEREAGCDHEMHEIHRIQSNIDNLISCKFSKNGKQIISGSAAGGLYTWDIASGKLVLERKNCRPELSDYDFSPDGKYLVCKDENESNTICLIDAANGTKIQTFKGHTDIVTCCKFSPDGKQVLSVSLDTTIRIWDIASGDLGLPFAMNQRVEKELNLAGVNIEDAVELSNLNLRLLYQRGAFGFNEEQRQTFTKNLGTILRSQSGNETTLNLNERDINDEIAYGIGTYTEWTNLRVLDLSQNKIEDGGAIGLGRNTTWINLEVLILSDNWIKDDGAEGLSKNSAWKQLKSLNLRNNRIENIGAQCLSANAAWINLKDIYLKDNKLEDIYETLRTWNDKWHKVFMQERKENSNYSTSTFGSFSSFESIKELSVYKDERKTEFSSIIAKRGDSSLQLNGDELRKEGLLLTIDKDDAHLLFAPNLQSLDLRGENLTLTGLEDLATKNCWFDLKELYLSANCIGDKGIERLAKSISWTQLKKLVLSSNNIGDEGVAALGKHHCWNKLEELDLSVNLIGDEGTIVIARHDRWKLLKKLDLSNNKIEDKGSKAIGEAKSVTSVEELNLSHNKIGNKGAMAIGNNTSWVNLKKLLLHNNKIGDEGGETIGKNRTWVNLETLSLNENNIADYTIVEIANNTAWPKLKILHLKGNQLCEEAYVYLINNPTWANTIEMDLEETSTRGREIVRNLMKSSPESIYEIELSDKELFNISVTFIGRNTSWENLRRLDLSLNNIGIEGGVAIGGNKSWYKLEELDMSYNFIGDKGAIAIGNNTAWVSLHTLLLKHNGISDAAAFYVRNSPTWKNTLRETDLPTIKINPQACKYLESEASESITKIELKDLDLPDSYALMLANNSKFEHLEKLNLSGNRITDEGGLAIGKDLSWQNLQELDLSYNLLGDKSAEEISKNDIWKSLRILNLATNKISDEGGEAIGKNISWTNLEELRLNENMVGDRSAKSIGKNTSWKELNRLILNTNNISDEGCVEIARNKTWKKLIELNFSSNKIGDQGTAELAANVVWSKLKKLHLGSNRISDEGGVAIGRNTIWTELEELYLWKNNLGEASAKAIGSNLTWKKLKKLELSMNEINDEGGAVIGANTAWTELEELHLVKNKIGNRTAIAIANNSHWTSLRRLNLSASTLGISLEALAYIKKHPNRNNSQATDLPKIPAVEDGQFFREHSEFWEIIYSESPTHIALIGNNLSSIYATILGGNSSWENLRSIDLSNNNIGDEGGIAIGRNKIWRKLEKLNLQCNNMNDEGAMAIGSNFMWVNLTELLIYKGNTISGRAALHIISNKTWNLKETDLPVPKEYNGYQGFFEILQKASLNGFEELNLSSKGLNFASALAIENILSGETLQRLDLSNNKLNGEAGFVLGRNNSWKNLEVLDLSKNEIGDEGAEGLGRNVAWKRLKDLDLSKNLIESEGAAKLGSNQSWINLISLNLANNILKDEGLANLSSNSSWMNLEVLNLAKNNIGPEGILALSKNEKWKKLRHLNLSWNRVGNEGTKHLSFNSAWKYLENLNLEENQIAKTGAAALGNNGTWVSLKKLDLTGNFIDDEGAKNLSQNVTWNNLQVLNLTYNEVTSKGIASIRQNSTWKDLDLRIGK